MIDAAVKELEPVVGTSAACRALATSRAGVYRHGHRAQSLHQHRASQSTRALSDAERGAVLEVLHDERFVDRAPAEVYATLLDEGKYLASERTMYRILAANKEVRERRNQLRHPNYAKPELLATKPNQLWSWDIERHEAP